MYVYQKGITAAKATDWNWNIGWIAAKPIMSSTFCASTTATSGWKQTTSSAHGSTNGVYRIVDISGCGFTSAPIVSSSLTGSNKHWKAKGGSYQYHITATNFRVYVNLPGITTSKATGWDWKIGWIAEPNV